MKGKANKGKEECSLPKASLVHTLYVLKKIIRSALNTQFLNLEDKHTLTGGSWWKGSLTFCFLEVCSEWGLFHSTETKVQKKSHLLMTVFKQDLKYIFVLKHDIISQTAVFLKHIKGKKKRVVNITHALNFQSQTWIGFFIKKHSSNFWDSLLKWNNLLQNYTVSEQKYVNKCHKSTV